MEEENNVTYKNILFGIVFCAIVAYLCITFVPIKKVIHNYYQVYLGGEKIGLISNKEELLNLIDEEQQEIKDKYHVDKVYSPSGLEIMSVSTYKTNVMSAREVYDEIKDIDPFTIEGYEVTVNDGKKKTVFYILDKSFLDEAVRHAVLAFVKEETYDKYLKGEQDAVVDTGTEITNIYLKDNVSIKKTYVSTDELIFTDIDELNMYFLFGTTNLDSIYKVKVNDTVESIAYKNKLGVSDFLIANPDIAGENALLAVGQEVTVANVSPLSDIVIESFETEYQTIRYETKIVYDKTLNADQTFVKQQGSNGLTKVTFATKQINNSIVNTAQVKNEVIREAVDKIIVLGAKNVIYYGNTTYWAWPTVKPFRISSHYGYRVHPIRKERHLHNGVDITGTSSRNIFAIQSGVVKQAGWGSGGTGIQVVIDHGNGYTSIYMHLKKALVKVGKTVEKGQLIGLMGCTGSCTGTHLHLTVKKCNKDKTSCPTINPLTLYK
ncbi:MAG: M23 family metallopeptidase [Bacilli bacterium]|nr:M23 family metallopeptidase [Bacilli bacterium]